MGETPAEQIPDATPALDPLDDPTPAMSGEDLGLRADGSLAEGTEGWDDLADTPAPGQDGDQPAPGQDAHPPAADTTLPEEGQPPAQAQPPQTAREPLPDNVDIEAMTVEEYAAWATANPDTARRMSLCWKDYSDKNAERNRQQEQLERDRAALEADRVALEAERAKAPQAAPETPEQPSISTADAQQVYEDLTKRLGRGPTDVEYINAVIAVGIQRGLEQVVGPVRETAEQTQNVVQQEAYRAFVSRVEQEFSGLVQEYPQASAPQVKQAIVQFCNERQMGSSPGDVRTAFFALFGEDIVKASAQGHGRARQAQAAAGQAIPGLPPGTNPGPMGPPPTSDMQEIARRQRQRLLSGELG